MKRCTKCAASKPEAEFNASRADCRACQSACKRAWYLCNREYAIAQAKANDNPARHADWRRRNREKIEARRRERYAQNPQVQLARVALTKALRIGQIKRQPCWVCGAEAQAHHASYSLDARLDVTWLCVDHHAQVHAEFRRYQEAA